MDLNTNLFATSLFNVDLMTAFVLNTSSDILWADSSYGIAQHYISILLHKGTAIVIGNELSVVLTDFICHPATRQLYIDNSMPQLDAYNDKMCFVLIIILTYWTLMQAGEPSSEEVDVGKGVGRRILTAWNNISASLITEDRASKRPAFWSRWYEPLVQLLFQAPHQQVRHCALTPSAFLNRYLLFREAQKTVFHVLTFNEHFFMSWRSLLSRFEWAHISDRKTIAFCHAGLEEALQGMPITKLEMQVSCLEGDQECGLLQRLHVTLDRYCGSTDFDRFSQLRNILLLSKLYLKLDLTDLQAIFLNPCCFLKIKFVMNTSCIVSPNMHSIHPVPVPYWQSTMEQLSSNGNCITLFFSFFLIFSTFIWTTRLSLEESVGYNYIERLTYNWIFASLDRLYKGQTCYNHGCSDPWKTPHAKQEPWSSCAGEESAHWVPTMPPWSPGFCFGGHQCWCHQKLVGFLGKDRQ